MYLWKYIETKLPFAKKLLVLDLTYIFVFFLPLRFFIKGHALFARKAPKDLRAFLCILLLITLVENDKFKKMGENKKVETPE